MSDFDNDSQQWVDHAGQLLRQHEQQVPDAVGAQLRLARQAAIAASQTQAQSTWAWPTLATTGVFAAAITWVVLLSSPDLTLPKLDEAELAAAQEAELLEELDFVAWMVDMESSNATPNQG
jgi:hypothetical protein